MKRVFKFGLQGYSRNMSDRDRLMMSPIEKWVKYRRFPFKFIVHAMLLAIVWIEVTRSNISLLTSNLMYLDFNNSVSIYELL